MTDLNDRVDQLEIAALRSEVSELKKTVAELQPAKGLLDTLSRYLPLFTPFLLAAFGVWATLNITSSIDQRRLELAELDAISEFMVEMRSTDVTKNRARAAAISLAAYGEIALDPLLQELNAEGQVRPLAAMEGMRALALNHPDLVCDQLESVLAGGNRLFTWQMHRLVIELLGGIGDRETVPVLDAYADGLHGPQGMDFLRERVRANPAPTVKGKNKLLREIDEARRKLAPQNGGGG